MLQFISKQDHQSTSDISLLFVKIKHVNNIFTEHYKMTTIFFSRKFLVKVNSIKTMQLTPGGTRCPAYRHFLVWVSHTTNWQDNQLELVVYFVVWLLHFMSQQVLVEVQKLAHKSGQHALAQTHRKCTQRWIKTQLKIHLEES